VPSDAWVAKFAMSLMRSDDGTWTIGVLEIMGLPCLGVGCRVSKG